MSIPRTGRDIRGERLAGINRLPQPDTVRTEIGKGEWAVALLRFDGNLAELSQSGGEIDGLDVQRPWRPADALLLAI
jgi:hypothetical protein